MKPAYYSTADFGFDRNRISNAALDVVEGLQEAGYDGYLVGGCVRDLLLGMKPKDFDVTTNATPEQVRKLFRRAHIIGRRFKIWFTCAMVERSSRWRPIGRIPTIRRARAGCRGRSGVAKRRQRPMRMAACWMTTCMARWRTTPMRRDFTVNALYYDPVKEQIVDFLGGVG